MIEVVNATNVNEALGHGLALLSDVGMREDSRNGPVLVAPGPVITTYTNPCERVLFSPIRDANPFFHLFEALWMLAGRDDVAYVHRFAPMMLYSDDNKRLNGAYGFRWRKHFGYDQVDLIIEELKKNPRSRRCVLAMWDAVDWRGLVGQPSDYVGDLQFGIAGGKDIPCNTHVYFRAYGNTLDMTVCNRSNDVVWGAYGANAVHFSVLQEYVAGACGMQVGTYYQVSNNFHVYLEREDTKNLLDHEPAQLIDDRYTTLDLSPTPLMVSGLNNFDLELKRFMTYGTEPQGYAEPIFTIARIMALAHALYKQEKLGHALEVLSDIRSTDWGCAAYSWVDRRYQKRLAKEAS